MSWQNAFDLGECTVRVCPQNFSGGFDPPMWSGVLGKGDSSPEFTDTLTGLPGAKVAVDANGAVALTIPEDNGYIYAVDVLPSYDLSLAGLQAVVITAYVYGGYGFASNLAENSPVVIRFQQGGAAPEVAPDTALLTGSAAIGFRVTNGQGGE